MSRPWTKEDDDRLREMWGVMPLDRISGAMGRTECALYQRATSDLGLPAGCPDGWEFLSHAAERAGYTVATLRKVLLEADVQIMESYTPRTGCYAAKGKRRKTRAQIVWRDAVDLAVKERCEKDMLHSAAMQRGMSDEKLRAILTAYGVEAPKPPPAYWHIPARVMKARGATKKEPRTPVDDEVRSAILALGVQPPVPGTPWQAPLALVTDKALREKLLAVGATKRIPKAVWRVRTETVDAAVEDWNRKRQGKETVKDAARRCMVNIGTLSKWLKKHGFEVRVGVLHSESDVNRVVAAERKNVQSRAFKGMYGKARKPRPGERK